MITPNGRFKCMKRICLNISDYHPETWNPVINVATIIVSLISFMLTNEKAVGVIETTRIEK